MPSFSNIVKEELCSGVTDRDKMYACLYGAILFSRGITYRKISFSTESLSFARLLERLFSRVFEGKIVLETEKNVRKNGLVSYLISAEDGENVQRILSEYKIEPEKREINRRNIVNNSLNSFLAGVFSVCGSVSDPYKEYHMEFCVPEDGLAAELGDLLRSLGIETGKAERKNSCILYLNDSENIEDILTFIGARQCSIDLMNIKIYKDVRNRANRVTNCDSANINKIVSAASRQIEDINVIMDSENGLDSLPPILRETARLRLENPEMSLSELGESMNKPIGRSGVVKRFRKIALIADGIRRGEN